MQEAIVLCINSICNRAKPAAQLQHVGQGYKLIKRTVCAAFSYVTGLACSRSTYATADEQSKFTVVISPADHNTPLNIEPGWVYCYNRGR